MRKQTEEQSNKIQTKDRDSGADDTQQHQQNLNSSRTWTKRWERGKKTINEEGKIQARQGSIKTTVLKWMHSIEKVERRKPIKGMQAKTRLQRQHNTNQST